VLPVLLLLLLLLLLFLLSVPLLSPSRFPRCLPCLCFAAPHLPTKLPVMCCCCRLLLAPPLPPF